MPSSWILPILTLWSSALYSSVGHGGASAYLAILAFSGASSEAMSSSALILNLLVAGISFTRFKDARHFSWSLTWPFLAGSIPAAYAGSLLPIEDGLYRLLLSAVLLFAGCRLWLIRIAVQPKCLVRASQPLMTACGGGIGFLSGMVGVGGGIFLSPLMILAGWADPKTTAASSSFFILMNSFAGLLGRASRDALILSPDLAQMAIFAFAGSWIGSEWGAHRGASLQLRRVLSLVLMTAALKLGINF